MDNRSNSLHWNEGLAGSTGLSAEIDTLKVKMQELIQSTDAIMPLKGAVHELLDLKNSFIEIKTQMLDEGHQRQDEVSDIKRTLDDLNDCIENMTQESEEQALEVENSRREMRGDIQSIKQNLAKEVADRQAQHTTVWGATQDLMTSFQESTHELSKQYLEWQDYKDEAQRDFERSRKILDYLLIHSFGDGAKMREEILSKDVSTGDKILGSRVLGEPGSPRNPTAASKERFGRRMPPRLDMDVVATSTRDSVATASNSSKKEVTLVEERTISSAGLVDLEAMFSTLAADVETLSADNKRIQKEHAKLSTLAPFLENLTADSNRIQKEQKALNSKFTELDSEVIRKPQFESLRKDAVSQGTRVQNAEQELSNLSAKFTLHRQELSEVSERQEQHASEVKRKLQVATQSMTQMQSDLQAELQQQLRSHASSISVVETHLQSQLSSLVEKPTNSIATTSTTLAPDVEAVRDFERRISGLYEQVNLILQKDSDVERRISGVWEQVNLISQKDLVTKKEFVDVAAEVWEAISASQSSEGSQAALREEIAQNHRMVWEAVLQLQMKQHEDAKSSQASGPGREAYGPGREAYGPGREAYGAGSLVSGGSLRALNADPRSGNHTPRQMGSARTSVAGSRPQSRDISPAPNHMPAGSYAQVITQHTKPQIAAPASPGMPAGRQTVHSPSPRITSFSPKMVNSPSGVLPYNALIVNGTGS